MNKERLKILTMLEEGKITSTEAINLLNALDSSSKEDLPRARIPETNSLSHNIEDILGDFTRSTSPMVGDLSGRLSRIDKKLFDKFFSTLGQYTISLKSLESDLNGLIEGMIDGIKSDADPVFSKISQETETLTKLVTQKDEQGSEGLLGNMQEVQNSFKDMPIDVSLLLSKLPGILGNINPGDSGIITYSKTYMKAVQDCSSTGLEFECLNGNLTIEGYDGPEILIELYCKTHENHIENVIQFMDKDDAYSIKVKDNGCTWVSMDIKIPKQKFKYIYASTSDAKIEICNLLCSDLICSTSNGKISLSGLDCGNIKGSTCDEKVELSDIKCDNIFIKTCNSSINADNTRSNTAQMNTSAGDIYLEVPYDIYGRNEYNLSTSCGKIDIELSVSPDTGLCIDAFSSGGSIDIKDIPGLSYKANEQAKSTNHHVYGESQNYSTSANSVKITAQTSDSTITIK